MNTLTATEKTIRNRARREHLSYGYNMSTKVEQKGAVVVGHYRNNEDVLVAVYNGRDRQYAKKMIAVNSELSLFTMFSDGTLANHNSIY